MNAEFSVEISYTLEFESTGIALTVFAGADSDGDVYTAKYEDLVADLIEMCTYDEDGRMEDGDRDYLLGVVKALNDATLAIATAVANSRILDLEPDVSET